MLYAGTNLHRPLGSTADLEPVAMMPVIGAGPEKQQPNVAVLAQIEQLAAAQLCEIFGGHFAEPRFHSCTQANLAVFLAVLRPGDTVMCLSSADGGHVSQNGDGVLAHLSVNLISMPFDADNQCIDDGATASLVRRHRPRLVILGPSVIVRPSDMTQTAAACADSRVLLVVDVSHVAGLIAGGVFPNPLQHGADLITASSYKTLGCPPAGFIVARDDHLQRSIESATSPKLLSNYDAARLTCFLTALTESRSSFGSYAQAILANAEALRAALRELDVLLLAPMDRVFGTHQVVVLTKDRLHATSTVNRLQEAGVTTSVCGIPGRPGSWGIRLGTQLVTRRGLGADAMALIARLVANALE